jgi:replicative DNA helicase
MELGRILPQYIELEEIIIGTLFYDAKVIPVIFGQLLPMDFYKSSHQLIFEVAKKIYDKGGSVDIMTVAPDCKKNNIDVTELMRLSNLVNSTMNIEEHLTVLKDYSAKRKLIEINSNVQMQAYTDEATSGELIGGQLVELENLINRVKIERTMNFRDECFHVFAETKKHDSIYLGIPTPWHTLNKYTSGLSAPDLIIVAAGPGEGKTSFALNLMQNIRTGRSLFFSYDMNRQQLIWKLMISEMDLSVTEIRQGRATDKQMDNCKFWNNDILIIDTCPDISELVSLCKYEKAKCIKEGTELKAVFDYIQLIPVGGYGKRSHTRNDELTVITRKLKQLAMSVNVPVVALSQVSRDKTRKYYVLADLRESGAIEQDADGVIFIWRPESHNHQDYKLGSEIIQTDRTDAFLSIAKWRLGETGEFRIKFRGEFNRFDNFEEDVYLKQPVEDLPF